MSIIGRKIKFIRRSDNSTNNGATGSHEEGVVIDTILIAQFHAHYNAGQQSSSGASSTGYLVVSDSDFVHSVLARDIVSMDFTYE